LKQRETSWKFVLVGGDPQTNLKYIAAAALRTHHLDCFASMDELGYLGRFCEYDAALVFDDLEPISGLELAECIDVLLGSLPIILLSRQPFALQNIQDLPSSLIACVQILPQADGVIDAVLSALYSQQNVAKFLAPTLGHG
jgi:hypothetical protein